MKHTKSTDDQGWPAAIGALTIFGLALTLSLVAAGGWSWFQQLLESSAPAWVQALGSIGAILAATEIGRRQIAAQRQVERERQYLDDRKKLQVIGALLEAIEAAVALAKKQYNKHPEMPIHPFYLDRIENGSKALAKIDLFSCPSPVIQPLLHLFPSPCEALLITIREFNDSFDKLDGKHEKYWPQMSNSFTMQEMDLADARMACHSAMDSQSS